MGAQHIKKFRDMHTRTHRLEAANAELQKRVADADRRANQLEAELAQVREQLLLATAASAYHG